MKCKYFASQFIRYCTHKDNKDRRSRLTNGKLRRFPKRCNKEFCPLKKFGQEK